MARDDKGQNLLFPRRQRSKAQPKVGNNLGLLTSDTILLDSYLYRIKELLFVQRFGQKFDSPGFHCPYGRTNLGVSRNKYDGDMNVRLQQGLLKFQSTFIGQPNIQHDAARGLRNLALKKFPS